jgi:CO/xanthine dehydrogenase Mo-binding subunit
MHGTNTNSTPFDRSTGASRSTTVMGNAVRAAAQELRQQIINAAAELLSVEAKSIELKDGEVSCGDNRIRYDKIVRLYFGMPGGELIGRGYIRPDGGMDTHLPVLWKIGMGGVSTSALPMSAMRSIRSSAKVNGRLINPNLIDYRAPFITDLPKLFESLLVEIEMDPALTAPREWANPESFPSRRRSEVLSRTPPASESVSYR